MSRCKCCWHKYKEVMEFFRVDSTITVKKGEELNTIQTLLREDAKKTKMMEELYKKTMDLEERLSKLEKKDRKKNKKNILDYLKETPSSCLFSKWVESIELTEDEFNMLRDYDYKECMMKVIKNRLSLKKEIPFCAFTELKYNVYFYTHTGAKQEGWYKMENNDVKTLIYKMNDNFNKYYF